MRKSISFKEYRKRSADFDNITDGKNEEEVEELVRNIFPQKKKKKKKKKKKNKNK
jgi:hypothetical protein